MLDKLAPFVLAALVVGALTAVSILNVVDGRVVTILGAIATAVLVPHATNALKK